MTTEQTERQLRADDRHELPGTPASGSSGDGRAERFARLIFLLADGREWAARSLSTELNVSVRTIRRDMHALERQELVAKRTSGSRRGCFRLLREPAANRPHVTSREMIALLLLAAKEAVREDGSGAAFQAAITVVELLPQGARDALLTFVELVRGQPTGVQQRLFGQPWLPILLEGLADSRPLNLWMLPAAGLPIGPMLEVMPRTIDLVAGRLALRGVPISNSGADVLDLAQLAAVEFVTAGT